MITLTTFQYLESQGQGSSVIPRLVGFQSTAEREFFELFTTVKGIGNRRALRAMAEDPGVIGPEPLHRQRRQSPHKAA